MPIYEYRAVDGVHCRLCTGRFEVRQRINDGPLKRCPECGAEIRRLFSRHFLLRKGPPGQEETFGRCTGKEADELGTGEDFAQDEVWE